MTTSAVVFPTSSSNWTSSNNANATDGVFATDVATRTYYGADGSYEYAPTANLVCASFSGLNSGVGAGDVINGITVTIRLKQSGGGGTIVGTATLALSGSVVGTSKSISSIGTTLSDVALGSSSDSWGASLVGADLANLQVVFSARMSTGTGTSTISVDSVTVQVAYTAATPSAFTFTDIGSATLSTLYTSNPVTVAGLGGGVSVAVYVTGGQYEKNSSGSWLTSPGTAINGDSFRVRQTSSASGTTATDCTLSIGGRSDTYTVTTAAADTTPDAFSLSSQTGVTPGAVATSSSTVVVSGINASTAISISGASGQYSKNGGAYTSSAGTVVNGDSITVRGTASASYSTLVTVTLTIGGVNGTFNITTRSANTSPGSGYAWTDLSNQTGSATVSSNVLPSSVFSGLEASANLTFSNVGGTVPQYSKNGGAWTAIGATTVVSSDTSLQLRITLPATGTCSITTVIGGVSRTWNATVTATDTVPDAFSFTAASALPSVLTASGNATITGINVAVSASVGAGHELNVNGAGFTAGPTNVTVGQTVAVRATSSPVPGAVVPVILTIGGVSGTFNITTRNSPPPADF